MAKNQTVLSICAKCQLEFPEVNKAVQNGQRKYGIDGRIVFSHGYCMRHFIELLEDAGVSEEDIRKEVKDSIAGGHFSKDLEKHPELVKQWSSEIWEPTRLTEDEKPVVRMCSWCQKINDPQFAQYARGIDIKIREEMKVVDQQVKDNEKNFKFTHGVCIPHVVQTYKEMPNMTNDKLNSVVNRALQSDPPPCLLENEPLRHAYMKGLFTPELIQQATKAKHQQQLEERQRFKKLAGIRG